MRKFTALVVGVLIAVHSGSASASFGVRTGPGINDGRVLPSTNDAALEQFGPVDPDSAAQIDALISRFDEFAKLTGKHKWAGPPLFAFTGPGPLNFSKLTSAELRKVFSEYRVSRPTNIGARGDERFVIVRANYVFGAARTKDFVLIAFVFEEGAVSRVVFNFPPLIQVAGFETPSRDSDNG